MLVQEEGKSGVWGRGKQEMEEWKGGAQKPLGKSHVPFISRGCNYKQVELGTNFEEVDLVPSFWAKHYQLRDSAVFMF